MNPVYFGLAHSFMSDVPFLALILLAMWLFVRGTRRNCAGCLIAAFALALLDILIRQFALVAVGAFGIATIFRRGISARTLAVAILPVAAGLALHLGYAHWLIATGRMPLVVGDTMADLIPASATAFVRRSAANGVMMLPYIGFFASPFLLACLAPLWRRLPRRQQWIAGSLLPGCAALLLAAIHFLRTDRPISGNVLVPPGMGPSLLRDAALLHMNLPPMPLWMQAFWVCAIGLGALAGVAAAAVAAWQAGALVAALWRHETRRQMWLTAVVISLCASYGLALLLLGVKNLVLDRYLLLFGPLVCLLALAIAGNRGPSVVGDRAAAALLVVLGLFSVGATHDYLAWNRARWAATAALGAAGVDARRIDGGYEFNGWLTYDPAYAPTDARSWWWVVDDEYVVASGPVPGYRVEKEYFFSRWLLAERGRVVTLHRIGMP